MVQYYKFDYDEGDEEDMVCIAMEDFEEEYGFTMFDLTDGKVINCWPDPFYFYFDQERGGKKRDWLINDVGWMLVSPRIKKSIEQFSQEGEQYFPVIIKEIHTGEEIKDYTVINITKVVDALDYEKTVFDKLGTVLKPVFQKTKLKGSNLFRVKDKESDIIISQTLKDALINSGVTGCTFTEVMTV